jgi:hypothetical protein
MKEESSDIWILLKPFDDSFSFPFRTRAFETNELQTVAIERFHEE